MGAITYTAKRQIENDTAGFVALFKDLGAGQVDTSLWRGVGPATFTRATAAACRLGSGLWKLDVAAGVPRSHYLPDLSYGGYLCEGAATQLITPAAAVRDMTNAAWVKTSMTAAKTSVGIDGVANACTRLTATGANATALFTLTAAASSRTYSFYVKRITGAGNIQITQDNGGTWTTVAVTAAFTLVQLNASVLNAVFGIRIVTNADAIDVDVNQFEAGTFATTPIPAAGVRNADALTYPFPGNADPAIGTAYAEVTTERPAALTIGNLILLWLGSGGGALMIPDTNPDTLWQNNDGISAAAKSGMTSPFNSVRKRASRWGGGMAITGDGLVPGTVGSFVGWAGSVIYIGSQGGANFYYGTVKNLRIYQQAVTDAILQQMTIFGTDYARIPGQSYSLEFYTEKADRSVKLKRSSVQPIGGGAAEVLLQSQEATLDVTVLGPEGALITEAQMLQYREFLASVAAGEIFVFDRYGTIAAPVEPKNCQLTSESYMEERIAGPGNTGLYKLTFSVRVLN